MYLNIFISVKHVSVSLRLDASTKTNEYATCKSKCLSISVIIRCFRGKDSHVPSLLRCECVFLRILAIWSSVGCFPGGSWALCPILWWMGFYELYGCRIITSHWSKTAIRWWTHQWKLSSRTKNTIVPKRRNHRRVLASLEPAKPPLFHWSGLQSGGKWVGGHLGAAHNA